MAKAMKIGEVVPVGVFDVHANGVKVVGYLEAWVERSLAISAVDGLISVGRARFKVGDQMHGQEVALDVCRQAMKLYGEPYSDYVKEFS